MVQAIKVWMGDTEKRQAVIIPWHRVYEIRCLNRDPDDIAGGCEIEYAYAPLEDPEAAAGPPFGYTEISIEEVWKRLSYNHPVIDLTATVEEYNG